MFKYVHKDILLLLSLKIFFRMSHGLQEATDDIFHQALEQNLSQVFICIFFNHKYEI